MANLVRREVFDELVDFRRSFDHMLNSLLTGPGSSSEQSIRVFVEVPPIEARVDKETKKYHLRIALPGADPKDLQVELQGNNLTVRGEHKSSQEKKEENYVQREFSYGRFERTVALPEGAETAKLTAEYNNGVLEITAPLSEAALPKQIEVKTTAKAKGAGA